MASEASEWLFLAGGIFCHNRILFDFASALDSCGHTMK